MPDDLFAYAEQARGRGLAAIIAGAGGAAHLPGMLAARRPCRCSACGRQQAPDGCRFAALDRADAKGVPVATFAIGDAGAANAALFAVAMLARDDAGLRDRSMPIAPARPKRRVR